MIGFIQNIIAGEHVRHVITFKICICKLFGALKTMKKYIPIIGKRKIIPMTVNDDRVIPMVVSDYDIKWKLVDLWQSDILSIHSNEYTK